MSKQVRVGDFENAIAQLLREGGQVFPGRDGSDGITHMCGSRQTIYWQSNSKKRPQMVRQAEALGYPEPELATGGALVRHVLQICGIDFGGTYFHPCWRQQAKEGWHWHYMFFQPGLHGICMEIDLASAYMSAFLGFPSCFLHGSSTWMHDKGGIANLRAIAPLFEKWFRLQFLGTLASWKMRYIVRDSSPDNPYGYIEKHRYHIRYGYLFNAAHKAILKVFGDLKRAHQIAGDDCVRCHTDSLLVKIEGGMPWEKRLCDFLQGQGYELKIKKIGDTWISGINQGFVGFYPIGAKNLAFDAAKKANIRLKKPDERYLRSFLATKEKSYSVSLPE